MPKKTKKEKIIAEYRRKLSTVSSHQEAINPVIKEHTVQTTLLYTPQFSVHTASVKNESAHTVSLDPQEFSAIKKDLFITLILTGCILVGQIIIWRVVG